MSASNASNASSRVVCWFSCGAASAVAAYQAIKSTPTSIEIAYCDTSVDEHPDNERFLNDVESWVGLPVTRLKGEYTSVEDVFASTRYMAGINGARCTVEMKKKPRFAYQRPDDIHVFGFTSDEQTRIQRFNDNNPELLTWFPLAESGTTKEDCFRILRDANIDVPAMYRLGYRNNNCIGCVKATSARYWNMVRKDFPDVFQRRAEQSRDIGVRLTRVRGQRVFLDELPADYLSEPLEDISCGPDCGVQPVASWDIPTGGEGKR